MKRSTLIILSFILFFPLMPHHPSAAQSQPESDAPYIYYYSDLLNAFVIERADGTDSRIFGDGLMPENPYIGDEPGWSPSGRWFGWNDGAYPNPKLDLYLMDVSGTQMMTFVDEMSRVYAQWSPIDDILFSIEIKFEGEFMYTDDDVPHFSEATFSLIDPENDRIEVVHTDTIIGFSPFRPMSWANDGEYVYTRYSILRDDIPHTVYMGVSRGGEIVQHIESVEDFSAISQNGYFTHNVTYGDTQVTVYNLLSGDEIDYSVPSEAYVIQHDVVFKQGIMLRLVERSCEDGNQCPNIIWYLLPHENKSILLEYPKVYFSPEATNALLLDDSGDLWYLDMETFTISETNLPTFTTEFFQLFWQSNTIAIAQDGSHYFIYDLLLDAVEVIDVPDGFGIQPYFSNDLRYFVRARSTIPLIFDRQGESHPFVTHSGTRFDYLLDSIRWHFSTSWWISWESGSSGSGGGDLVSIRNVNGYRRELGRCYASLLCANWLPPQVDPTFLEEGNSTSVIPDPTEGIHNKFWTHRFLWSPDSRFLASQLVNTSEYVVWNVESHELITTFYGRGLEWMFKDDEYSAIVGEEPFHEPDVFAESPDGKQIVQPYDYGARIIDSATGEQIFHIRESTRSAAYSPDGQLLATSSPFFRVRIWNTQTWELITTLNTNATAVAFSPDGQTLAVASSWDIQLWDVETLLSTAN